MKNRIKEIRNKNRMSQAALAKELGIAQNTLSYWEQGKYDVDTESLVRIAEFFDCTIDYLLCRQEDLSSKAICKMPPEPSPDVANRMETILQELEQEEAPMFDGEPMDEESLELIRASLKIAYKIAMASKKISKKSDDV